MRQCTINCNICTRPLVGAPHGVSFNLPSPPTTTTPQSLTAFRSTAFESADWHVCLECIRGLDFLVNEQAKPRNC